MKKFLFSAIACGLMAMPLVSCQNEGDPSVPGQNQSTEASFPKGSEVRKVTVEMPEESRTRAGGAPFPLWVFGGGPEIEPWTFFNYRYAVYDDAGKLFYTSDEGNPINGNNRIELSVPCPAEAQNPQIFIWASKMEYEVGSQAYVIDWNAKTVTIPTEKNAMYNDMAKLADAWFYKGTAKPENSVSLKRPFVQIDLVSNELDVQKVKENYAYGITCQMNMVDADGNKCLPNKWNWETDKIEFTSTVGYNKVINPLGNTTVGGTQKTFLKATINKKDYEYLGVFYVFAPQTAGKWTNNQGGKAIEGLQFNIISGNGRFPVSISATNLPDVKANQHIVIYNTNDPGSGNNDGGILIGSGKLNGTVINSFDVGQSNPTDSGITFTRN